MALIDAEGWLTHPLFVRADGHPLKVCSMSVSIARPAHFGIGTAPLSQRATVAREIPKAEARPDCESPASLRSVIRVSCDTESPPMILATAGAFADVPHRTSAFGVANDFRDEPAPDSISGARGATGQTTEAPVSVIVPERPRFQQGKACDYKSARLVIAADDDSLSVPASFASVHSSAPCFGKSNVARRYRPVNNLYIAGWGERRRLDGTD